MLITCAATVGFGMVKMILLICSPLQLTIKAILMCAIDTEANKIWYGIDGTWNRGEDPVNSTNTYWTYDFSGQTMVPKILTTGSTTYTVQIKRNPQYLPAGFTNMTSGTVGSITDTTVTLDEWNGTWTVGENVVGPNKQPSGTVGSVDGTSVKLSANTGGWVDGNNVTGPQKTVIVRTLNAT